MRRLEDEARLNFPSEVGGTRNVEGWRIPAANRAPVSERCWVMEEQALFIEVVDVGTFTLMWTRTDAAAAVGYLAADGMLGEQPEPDALALTVGFLLTEGLIDRMADVAEMAVCGDSENVVRVRLLDSAPKRGNRRGGLIASSCGVCGSVDDIADLGTGLPAVPDSLRVEPASLQQLMASMENRQLVHKTTGGTHAAALFTSEANLLAVAEDLGRHNALDKVIGKCLLRAYPTAGCGAILSSRVSLELIVKAARAGIEIVAAVSAPSSLAIDAAEQLGITLCGFVREGRATIFSHPHRFP